MWGNVRHQFPSTIHILPTEENRNEILLSRGDYDAEDIYRGIEHAAEEYHRPDEEQQSEHVSEVQQHECPPSARNCR